MKKIGHVVVATLGVASASAMAALPTEATAAFATLNTNATDVIAAVWPILAIVVGGFALMKLFKKGASRAV